MGTVVFPDAILKFFLSANLEVRTKRRILEFQQYNHYITFKTLSRQIKNRDYLDQNRLISPLCIPENAIILDSSYMNIAEMTKILMEHIVKKIKNN